MIVKVHLRYISCSNLNKAPDGRLDALPFHNDALEVLLRTEQSHVCFPAGTNLDGTATFTAV